MQENEAGTSEQGYYFELNDMHKGLEGLIETVINSQNHDAAPELLSMTLGQIPESKILKLVIHDLLMKTQNEYTANMVFKYLNNFIDTYKPNEPEISNFYYEALTGGRNLWDVVVDIIRSLEVVPDMNGEELVSKIYNGKFILSYYIKVLTDEFDLFKDSKREMPREAMPEEAMLKESKNQSKKRQCLVAKLFWPDSESISMKDNCIDLLRWINSLYLKQEHIEKEEVLLDLHKLLTLMMKFILFYNGFSEIDAVKSQHFNHIALTVCQFCHGIFENPEKSAKFLTLIELNWLRILICENLVHKLIYHCWPYETIPLTLRKIVRQYMFVQCKDAKIPCKSSTNIIKPHKMKGLKRNDEGETDLHKACEKDKTGTLMELLIKPCDINVKDNYGWTPLHKACSAKSEMCVVFLCYESYHNKKVDFFAANNEGHIPLHVAVQSNSIGITEKLLENGGPNMLDVKDNKGKTPADYARNPEMKQLLKKFVNKFAVSQIVSIVEAVNIHNIDSIAIRKPPLLLNIKSYSIYLLFLEYVINDYIKIFRLNSIKRKNKTLKSTIGKHLKGKCSISPNINDVVALCDDLIFVQHASVIFEDFVKDLSEQTSEATIDISRPLMKFKLTCYLPYLNVKACKIKNKVS